MKIIKILFLTIISINLCYSAQQKSALRYPECEVTVIGIPDAEKKSFELAQYITYNNIKEVKNLLDNRLVNINSKCFGETALILASKFQNKEIVELLLDQPNIDVNIQDNNGFTALIHAAYFGKPEIVRLLLDKGADVNILDENGYTALVWASKRYSKGDEGFENVIELLLNSGADVNSIENALRIAKLWRHEPIVKLLKQRLNKIRHEHIKQAIEEINMPTPLINIINEYAAE